MAEITNPQVVNFANEYGRGVCNALSALNALSAIVRDTYLARDLPTPIEAGGAGNLITDGSQTDGRTRVTGGDIYNLITLLNDLNTFMTQGRKDTIAKWRVNG